ncbi:MAG: Thioredoxin [Mycoplasmataceae bacterium]|nr:MAG: Thioredoxin [Mycoplasmataceae bacterium]
MFKYLEREEDFDSFLTSNQDKLLLVKFSTAWCPPCKVLQKNIKELLTESDWLSKLKKEFIILEVDANKFSSLAQNSRFNICSVPTIFLFDQGKLIKKIIGSLSVSQLKEFIKI